MKKVKAMQQIKKDYINRHFLLSKIIPDVNCSRGSPMGRPDIEDIDPKEYKGRFYDFLVPMCSCCGAYDKGGAYWGSSRMGDIGVLRVVFNRELTYVNFYRTSTKLREQGKMITVDSISDVRNIPWIDFCDRIWCRENYRMYYFNDYLKIRRPANAEN